MKNKFRCVLLLLSFLGLIHPVLADQNQPIQNSYSNYRLDAGDKLGILVYGEPDLGLETILTDAGTITYPLLGEIKAAGLTIRELTALIVDGLKERYLVDPTVTINIIQYRDFYINGEVRNPGAYPYKPGLTVYKAVSIAGGFTERASRTSIYLIADKDSSQTPKEVELNAPVNPGDIINVEESFF